MDKTFIYCMLFVLTILLSTCRKSDSTASVFKAVFSVEEQKIIGDTLYNRLMSMPEEYIILDRDEYFDLYKQIDIIFFPLLTNLERRKDFDWGVTIIHDDNIRTAYTTPGGHLFIYTGLLRFFEAEYQLFGLLAHEVIYANKDHAINQLKDEYGGDVLGDLCLGNEVPGLSDILMNLPNLAFTESQVREADSLSINVVCIFTYHPDGLKTFLETARDTSLEIHWLNTRNLTDIQTRINILAEQSISCYENVNATQEEEYFDLIISKLP